MPKQTLKYAEVIVSRGPMEQIAKTVPLHELPILRAIHGKTSVQISKTIDSKMPVPDAEEEHARLCRAYGVHPKQHIPYCEYVYGLPESGALQNALNSATEVSQRPLREHVQAEAA